MEAGDLSAPALGGSDSLKPCEVLKTKAESAVRRLGLEAVSALLYVRGHLVHL